MTLKRAHPNPVLIDHQYDGDHDHDDVDDYDINDDDYDDVTSNGEYADDNDDWLWKGPPLKACHCEQSICEGGGPSILYSCSIQIKR